MEKKIVTGVQVASAEEAAQFQEDMKAGQVNFLRPVATDKGIEGFAEIAQQALSMDYGQAKGAIADAQAALKRIIKRAEAAPDERWEINVSRGPRLEFSGKLLCCDTFTTKARDPLEIELSIYQTEGGALIGVSSAVPAHRQGHETIEATVVEPTDDVQAMRFAIMDGFDWALHARSMVTKKLGWSLRREVL